MNLSKLVKNSDFTIVFNHPNESSRTFQEVVDAFNSANYIYVSSWGVTISNFYKNKLFEKLKEQSKTKPVKVITSIRKKNGKGKGDEEYWKEILEKKKKNVIGEKFLAYFCLTNHSKVILTDQIAYIGSENYTEYDGEGGNHEVGIITRDLEVIQFLKERLDHIITLSYREFEISEYFQMQKFIGILNETQELIVQNSYELSDMLFDYYPSKNNGLIDEEYATYDFEPKGLERLTKSAKGIINHLDGLLQQHLKKDELIPPFDKDNPRSKSQIINSTNILTRIFNLRNSLDDVKLIIKSAKKLKEFDIYEKAFLEEETDLEYWREIIDPVGTVEHNGEVITYDKNDTEVLNEANQIVVNNYENKLKEYHKELEIFSMQVYKIEDNYVALEKALRDLINKLSTSS